MVTACATGVHAIGDAARLIIWGDADVMVAGGYRAAMSNSASPGSVRRAPSTGFNRQPGSIASMGQEPRRFCHGRRRRCGGAQEYERAKRRGAKIYAEIAGYGMSGDAFHITAPAEGHDGAGPLHAGGIAQRASDTGPDPVRQRPRDVHRHWVMIWNWRRSNSCSATRPRGWQCHPQSATGHLLGAAGAVEAVFSILAIRDGVAPPTLNLDEPSRRV